MNIYTTIGAFIVGIVIGFWMHVPAPDTRETQLKEWKKREEIDL